MIFQISKAKGSAEYLVTQYGNLQNMVANLQIPSGTISNKVDWANLIYQGDKYLLTSKDVYEYYYRLYQLISFRLFLSKDKNGNAKFSGETETGLTILFANSFFDKKLYKRVDVSAILLSGIYHMGNQKSFIKKAFFNYILFTSTMLNDLADEHYAKKYFSKYKQEWKKLRAILNKIKEQEVKK